MNVFIIAYNLDRLLVCAHVRWPWTCSEQLAAGYRWTGRSGADGGRSVRGQRVKAETRRKSARRDRATSDERLIARCVVTVTFGRHSAVLAAAKWWPEKWPSLFWANISAASGARDNGTTSVPVSDARRVTPLHCTRCKTSEWRVWWWPPMHVLKLITHCPTDIDSLFAYVTRPCTSHAP